MDYTLFLALGAVVVLVVGYFVLANRGQKDVADHHPPPITCHAPASRAWEKIVEALGDASIVGRRWKIAERNANICRLQARYLIPDNKGNFDIDILMNLIASSRGADSCEIELSYIIMRTKDGRDEAICKATNSLIAETARRASG